jgi:hypothetical protein
MAMAIQFFFLFLVYTFQLNRFLVDCVVELYLNLVELGVGLEYALLETDKLYLCRSDSWVHFLINNHGVKFFLGILPS